MRNSIRKQGREKQQEGKKKLLQMIDKSEREREGKEGELTGGSRVRKKCEKQLGEVRAMQR